MSRTESNQHLDAVIEAALARAANVVPPPGLEGRILERVAQRRRSVARRLHGAGVAFVVVLTMAAVLDRSGSTPRAFDEGVVVRRERPVKTTMIPTVQIPPVTVPAAIPDKAPRRIVRPVEVPPVEPAPVERAPRPSLVPDIQIDSLSMSSLEMSDLSGS